MISIELKEAFLAMVYATVLRCKPYVSFPIRENAKPVYDDINWYLNKTHNCVNLVLNKV